MATGITSPCPPRGPPPIRCPPSSAVSLFSFIYVAYSGWNAATYVAEELKQPSRTLPLALTVGTTLVAALYVGLNLVFIYAAPLEDLKGETAVGALAASRLFGPQTAGIFAALYGALR